MTCCSPHRNTAVAPGHPVFTQIVHRQGHRPHTLSTLVVIGIALAVFIVFTAVMSWGRHYLVLHTGNRIDAVLLAGLRHLFKLSPRYFEQPANGRAGGALAGCGDHTRVPQQRRGDLDLDVPFLLIFLAIMF